MKTKSIIKRLTIFSSMVTLLFVLSSSDINKKNKDLFKLTKVSKNKIEYNNGTIYIGNDEYLETIKELGLYDVLVLDDRNNKDPNLKIYNSYKISNPDIRKEIIDGLLFYEEKYPSDWNRTEGSLINEWAAHNFMYNLGYKQRRTIDVDLNNGDEETYQIRKNLKK